MYIYALPILFSSIKTAAAITHGVVNQWLLMVDARIVLKWITKSCKYLWVFASPKMLWRQTGPWVQKGIRQLQLQAQEGEEVIHLPDGTLMGVLGT